MSDECPTTLEGLFESANIPFPGEEWQDHQGKHYMVVRVTIDAETHKLRIVYRERCEDIGLGLIFWDRPLSEWNEEVVREDYQGPRFTKVR